MDRYSLLIILLLFSLPVQSAVTQNPVYENYTSGASTTYGSKGWFKAANSPSYNSVNKSIGTRAIINVGGKQIAFPASARLAANAGQYFSGALRTTGPSGWGVAALLFAATVGIEVVDNAWKKYTEYVPPPGDQYSTEWEYYNGTYYIPSFYSYSDSGACNQPGSFDTFTAQTQNGSTIFRYKSSTAGCPASYYKSFDCSGASQICLRGPLTSECDPNASALHNGVCVSPYEGIAETPVQADWDVLSGSPIPDDVVQEFATNQRPENNGVPVEQPLPDALSPTTYPTSLPYQLPDGTWVQPYVHVTPQPDGTVSIVPFTKEVEGPEVNADGEAVPVPGSTPELTQEEEEKVDFCEDHADSIVCMDMGEANENESIADQDYNLSITQESSAFVGSCPSDRSFSANGQTYTISYEETCTQLSNLRPFVLALAWMSAAFIFYAAVRA